MKKTEPRPSLSWHLPVVQLALIVLALDQFSKYLVRELLLYQDSYPATGFFRFTHTRNTGSAFGIFQGQNTPLIFISFVGIGILLAIYFSQTRPGNLLRLSLGLQMGGAIGNLIDRLHQGWVTDFIDVGPWPVFNLADSSIVVGLMLLAWIFLRPSTQPILIPEPSSVQPTLSNNLACPICEGPMVALANGWRCSYCGVRERVDQSFAVYNGAVKESIPSMVSEQPPPMDKLVPGHSLPSQVDHESSRDPEDGPNRPEH